MPHEFEETQISRLRCEVRSVAVQAEKKKEEEEDITDFWKRITSDHNVPTLKKLVRMCLLVPHGNVDVERLFSKLSNIITKKRSCLDRRSIQALAFISSHLDASKVICCQVPITNKLRTMAANAKTLYKERLKQEKINEENEEREKRTKQLEAELQKEKEINKKNAKDRNRTDGDRQCPEGGSGAEKESRGNGGRSSSPARSCCC